MISFITQGLTFVWGTLEEADVTFSDSGIIQFIYGHVGVWSVSVKVEVLCLKFKCKRQVRKTYTKLLLYASGAWQEKSAITPWGFHSQAGALSTFCLQSAHGNIAHHDEAAGSNLQGSLRRQCLIGTVHDIDDVRCVWRAQWQWLIMLKSFP